MKFTPSMAGSMSGSLGGFTASHNRGGQYLRRRSTPTNPNTSRQQTVRAIMDNLAQYWTNNLSDAQRTAWSTYAVNTPFTDVLGQTITMSGFNAFIKANMISQQWYTFTGLPVAVLEEAPTTFNTGQSVVDVPTWGGFATANTVVLEATWPTPAPDDGDTYLFIAPPQNAGVKFFKGPYQLAAVGAFAATDDLVVITADVTDPTEWYSDHVPLAAWDGLYTPLRLINRQDDGRVSADFRMLVQFTDNTP